MRSVRQSMVHYGFELEVPRLDPLEEIGCIGLLSRLRSENSALDILRLALAGDEERLHQPVK